MDDKITVSRALIKQALAFVRWECFGECRTPGWDGPPPKAHEVAQALTAALAQPEPQGWRLVPIEPTEEMWTAGRDPVMYRDMNFYRPASMQAPAWQINPVSGQVEHDKSKGTTAVHVWRAMIAAAPKENSNG